MKPMSLSKPLLIAILLAGSTAAFCQDEIIDPGAKQLCASVKDVALPASDRPMAAEEKVLANCSSVDAYYGFGEPADPVKARKCAYAEVDRGEKNLLRGRSILMMVYANGKGASRNFDVALKLACSIGGAPGDSAGRVYQLDRLRKANWAGDNFSVCDHSSGRELYEQCAILQGRFDQDEREQKLKELSAKWSPREHKALHVLLKEAASFFKTQASYGVDLEATFEIQEETFLWNNFLSMLEQFERGELPKSSPEEFRRAEAGESAAFRQTQTGSAAHWGTVTRESLRKSEDAWRRYSAAWLAFARQKYPGVSEQSWKAWLDQERLAALSRFLR